MYFAVDANFLCWNCKKKKKKKKNNFFLVNLNKIYIGLYLNEKLSWANQIFFDSTKHFSKYRSNIFVLFIFFLLQRINGVAYP